MSNSVDRSHDSFEITVAKMAQVIDALNTLDDESGQELATGVAVHSDDLNPGDVFVAFRGEKNDGHEYIDTAFKNGASAVVAEYIPEGISPTHRRRILQVVSSKEAIAKLSAHWRQNLQGRIIAICGESGATVTKNALTSILSQSGVHVYAGPAGYRTSLGAAVSILRCPRSADYCVIEASLLRPGDGQLFAKILSPDMVLVTALMSAKFGPSSSHNLIWSEYSDFLQLSESELVIGFDVDDGFISMVPASRIGLNFSGKRSDLEFRIQKATGGKFGLTCKFLDRAEISLKTSSRDSACGLILAGYAASVLGAAKERIMSALESVTPADSRFELWTSPNGVTVVRDELSLDPISLRRAIRAFREYTDTMRGESLSRSGRYLAVIDCRMTEITLGQLQATTEALQAAGIERACFLWSGAPDDLGALKGVQGFECVNSVAAARSWLSANSRYGDSVYISAAPDQRLEDVTAAFLAALSPTRLYVNLDALTYNFRTFQRLVGIHRRVMPMVKALAYGTDNLAAVQALQVAGASMFAVSSVDEGAKLRHAGITENILVLLASPQELTKLRQNGLTPVVYSMAMWNQIRDTSEVFTSVLSFHLEVDTGMNRTGVSPSEAVAILDEVRRFAAVQVVGLMTHFASADDPSQDGGITRLQLERFEEVRRRAIELGHDVICHAANTAATIRIGAALYDMVRVGIGLHGVNPVPGSRLELKPVVSLVSRIVEVSDVSHGEVIGYGATFEADRDMRVAVVAAGYHDGVPRNLSNIGSVVVLGHECPIVGRISMDSMMVDVTAVPDIQDGVDVLIYGKWDGVVHSIDLVAELAETIPYELMARVSTRVQRIATIGGMSLRPLPS